MTLIAPLKRWLTRGFVPMVLSDAELMALTQLVDADLAALAAESDRQRLNAYRLDRKGRRNWHLRRCMPTACRVLRRLG